MGPSVWLTRAAEVMGMIALLLALVLGETMRIVAIGLCIGATVAFVATQIIRMGELGAVGLDITAFIGSSALLVVVMLVAAAIPAIRASRTDPVANLKTG